MAIEAVLLVWSIGYRAATQMPEPIELVYYGLRIVLLVAIIVLFVWITLRSFLTKKIIEPLVTISEANRRMESNVEDDKEVLTELPKDSPREIMDIAATRDRMLGKILAASRERLRMVEFIRETFGRYVSREVVEEVINNPEARLIGGRRQTVSILMSDLRGFTSLAETWDPEELVRLLNRYLSRMSDVILGYEGLIDEFVGDAILVIFGAPTKRRGDAARAVACAIAMQRELIEFNKEIAAEGFPKLEMGIGINTGQVIVGNIGSDKRVKYGIVGSAVNTAARIESNTVGGQVFIGEPTYTRIGIPLTVEKPITVMMKGLHSPLVMYPVTAVGEPYNLTLPEDTREPDMVPLVLDFEWWPLDGKSVVGEPQAGRTLTLGDGSLTADLGRPVKALSDLKIRFNFCVEAHCFEDIYAKVMEPPATGPEARHILEITSISQTDRAILEEWIEQSG